MFGSFTAMPLHNFNFHSHVLVDMADKPNFRMFRDSFDVRHRAWISNTIHLLFLIDNDGDGATGDNVDNDGDSATDNGMRQ